MREDDCYQVGEVIKTHGLNGEVSIFLDVDFPEDYQNLESVFLRQEGKLVPFFIESISINEKRALVKFEDVNSLEEAENILKSTLFLPLSQLPKLKSGFYYHDLVGCEIVENSDNLGTVISVYDLSGNNLLAADINGKEVLIPLSDELLLKVDIPNKRIEVSLPDGLLDLYNS